MLLDELATFIAASSTSFVVAPTTSTKVPIWKGGFRSEPSVDNTAVSLFESGGVFPLYTLSTSRTDRPNLQVISRSTSYVTARTNAYRIYNILAVTANSTMSGTRYVRITPTQTPFDLGRDGSKRELISCNYNIEKAPS